MLQVSDALELSRVQVIANLIGSWKEVSPWVSGCLTSVTLSVSGLRSSTHINMYLNYIIYYLIFYSISLFNMVIRVAALPSLSYIASLVSCASPWCAATPPPPPLTAAIAIPRGLSTLGLTSFRCGPIPGGGGSTSSSISHQSCWPALSPTISLHSRPARLLHHP
jgi:hypothetical protein